MRKKAPWYAWLILALAATLCVGGWVYVQAVLLSSLQARLTNVTADVILQ